MNFTRKDSRAKTVTKPILSKINTGVTNTISSNQSNTTRLTSKFLPIQSSKGIDKNTINKEKLVKKETIFFREKELNTLKKQTTVDRNINAIMEARKAKRIDDNIEEKKEHQELEELKFERTRLRKTMQNTRDAKALALISKKVIRTNDRIKKLMKNMKKREDDEHKIHIETEENEEEDEVNKSKISHVNRQKCFSLLEDKEGEDEEHSAINISVLDGNLDTNNYNNIHTDPGSGINSYKNYEKKSVRFEKFSYPGLSTNIQTQSGSSKKSFAFKKSSKSVIPQQNLETLIENNYKVSQLLFEYKIMQQKQKIDGNRFSNLINTYPNFYFLRKNNKKKLYEPCTKISNGVNLFNKSYRPVGFRQEKNKNSEKGKKSYKYYHSHKKSLEDMIEDYAEENSFDRKVFNTQVTNHIDLGENIIIPEEKAKSNRNSLRKLKSASFFPSKQPREPSACFSSVLNTNKTTQRIDEQAVRKFRETFTAMLKDSQLISKHITQHFRNNKRDFKESDYDNLLKLYDVLGKDKKVHTFRKHDKTHEEEAIELLKKIPKPVALIFNEAYKKIEYEDRILNKPKKEETTALEQEMINRKMQKEFRKVAWETMFMLGNNVDDGKDEEMKEPFEHHYSNLYSLEWLVKKRSVLKNVLPKFLTLKYD